MTIPVSIELQHVKVAKRLLDYIERMDRQLQRAAMHASGKQSINFQVMPAAKVTGCARGAGKRKAALGAEGRPAQLHRSRTAGAKRVARNPACHAARRNEKVHAFPKDLIDVDSDARSE